MMKYLILALSFIGLTLFFFLVYTWLFQRRQTLSRRMEEIRSTAMDKAESRYRNTFVDRILKPIYQRLVGLLLRLTPESINLQYQTLIYQAGESKRLKPVTIIAVQLLIGFAAALILFVMMLFSENGNFALVIVGAGVGFYLPYSLIKTNGNKRRREIEQKLPDFLDILYISVEAGLGFYMALKRVTERRTDVLGMELKWALDDISKGKDRFEALREVYARTGVEDLNSFLTAIIQAEQLGTNIAKLLKTQSKMMRLKRRQRSEEAAMKLPIKLIFPIIFFLFPVIYIVVLGPAILNAFENLKGVFF